MRALAGAAACSLVVAAPAAGQLQPDQVLVVYDSRRPDSRDVAEYYAGSAKVPGGGGGMPGRRVGVRVFDLATDPVAGPAGPLTFADVSRAEFRTRLRDPIRRHLAATDPAGHVRCLVLTKALPHRIFQASPLYAGDTPAQAQAAFEGGSYNNATVDAELTLLWQDLDAGEANGAGDSRADGLILNPYFRQSLPIGAWPTGRRTSAKNFVNVAEPAGPAGVYWTALPESTAGAAAPTALTPGDMHLVCRLDGPTVAVVREMIDRAQAGAVDVNTAAFVLDESGANSVADSGPNTEFDNQGPPIIRNGDDYEQTRDALTADGRFVTANVRYNRLANAGNFIVGPRISYPDNPIVLAGPVLLLAHLGSNHGGTAPGDTAAPPQAPARTTYAESFNYASGAVFNSLESYNGRAFGGLENQPGIPQEQARDFLGAGGTYALANAWEPLASTVPDNALLARNFLLGNLTFAEAAWTAIPGLSFQQLVVGDPLGRTARSVEDRTGDGRVDLEDLYTWAATPRDLNRNSVVNDVDRRIMEDAARASRDTDLRGGQR